MALWAILLILHIITSRCSIAQLSRPGSKIIPAVDFLLQQLQHETWTKDEEKCLVDTTDILYGVKNNTLWATWIWDAMQLPVGTFYGTRYHFGNYDQCLKTWSPEVVLPTQYCLVDLKFRAGEHHREFGPTDKADDYYSTPLKSGRRSDVITVGMCLPSVCSQASVVKITKLMFRLTHLPEGELVLDPRDCQRHGEDKEYPVKFYVFWSVLALWAVLAIICTMYNRLSEGTGNIVTNAFCITKNYNDLFKVSEDDIKTLHGMRFITASIAVLAHEHFFSINPAHAMNFMDIDEILSSYLGLAVMHMDIIVDTFLAASGMLLVRGLMTGDRKNLLQVAVKRYLRLIGPLAVGTLYFLAAADHMGSGPAWRRFNRFETVYCEQHWWRNFLMINTNSQTLCLMVTWYVSVDFQLAILGLFLIYLMRKNTVLGFTVLGVVATAFSIYVGLDVYWNKLPVLPFKDINHTISFRDQVTLNHQYFYSYVRCGSYFVGMIMGYLMAKYKPTEYRNIVGQKWSIIITVMSLTVMLNMIILGFYLHFRPYDAMEAAIMVITNRVIWAIAICALIGVFEYGNVPLVREFLSLPSFVPLSKLSYGLYLLHPIILLKRVFSARTNYYFSFYYHILQWAGLIVASYFASIFLYLTVEAPLTNISNQILSVRSKGSNQNSVHKESNGVKQQNGHPIRKDLKNKKV